MTTGAPGVTGLRVRMVAPAGWISLDLDPRTRSAWIRRLVHGTGDPGESDGAERGAARAWTQRQLAELEAHLRTLADRCVTAGVDLALVWGQLVSDAPHLLMASILVSVVPTRDGSDPMHGINRRSDRDGPADTTSMTINGRESLRRQQRTMRSLIGHDAEVSVLSIDYLVPVADDLVAVINASTPTPGLDPEFGALFDQMVASVRMI